MCCNAPTTTLETLRSHIYFAYAPPLPPPPTPPGLPGPVFVHIRVIVAPVCAVEQHEIDFKLEILRLKECQAIWVRVASGVKPVEGGSVLWKRGNGLHLCQRGQSQKPISGWPKSLVGLLSPARDEHESDVWKTSSGCDVTDEQIDR